MVNYVMHFSGASAYRRHVVTVELGFSLQVFHLVNKNNFKTISERISRVTVLEFEREKQLPGGRKERSRILS